MKPTSDAIPQEFALEPITVNQYVLDGQVKTWNGPTAEVYSTIETPDGNGAMGPTYLGQVSAMDEASALEAIRSSVKAFDRGMGEWPTMRVTDRIKCMEDFAAKMVTKRDEVVKL